MRRLGVALLNGNSFLAEDWHFGFSKKTSFVPHGVARDLLWKRSCWRTRVNEPRARRACSCNKPR